MVIFHDKDGNIVGSFESSLPGFEESVGLPSNADAAIVVPEDLAARFNDPQDEAHHFKYEVIDGEIVPKQTETQ